jgi:hypothetical protein
MTEARPTTERARFLVIFDVPRDQVDMKALQARIYDLLDRGGFAWEFAVGYEPCGAEGAS